MKTNKLLMMVLFAGITSIQVFSNDRLAKAYEEGRAVEVGSIRTYIERGNDGQERRVSEQDYRVINEDGSASLGSLKCTGGCIPKNGGVAAVVCNLATGCQPKRAYCTIVKPCPTGFFGSCNNTCMRSHTF